MPSQKPDNAVVESHNQPDYASVSVPSKPPSEFSYVERRADLLEQIMSLGHPNMIHQGQQAERFGVSQSQISKDLDRLGEYIEANLGDRRDLVSEAVYHCCIRGLLEEGEYRKAAQTVSDWNDYLIERKDLKELQEEIDVLRGELGGRDGGGRR